LPGRPGSLSSHECGISPRSSAWRCSFLPLSECSSCPRPDAFERVEVARCSRGAGDFEEDRRRGLGDGNSVFSACHAEALAKEGVLRPLAKAFGVSCLISTLVRRTPPTEQRRPRKVAADQSLVDSPDQAARGVVEKASASIGILGLYVPRRSRYKSLHALHPQESH
jgi:hypothetical protein